MLRITKNNIDIEINFDGIKVFQVENTTKFYKDNILGNIIFIDEKPIKETEIIYINELTKLSDFINLNKKSLLFKRITDLIDEYPLINYQNLENIKNKVNEEFNLNVLDSTQGDVSKLIVLLLEMINEDYLNENNFEIILKYFFDSKKTIILDNVSWLKINNISKYLNLYNFIVLTNDFRNNITSKEQLELLVIFNKEYNYNEILDSDKLIIYLEQKLNIEINDDQFSLIISDLTDINSIKSYFYIKNI